MIDQFEMQTIKNPLEHGISPAEKNRVQHEPEFIDYVERNE